VWGSNFADLFGAAHSFEIPFVFGQFRFLGSADRWVFTKKNEADRLGLSKRMQAYWGEFAYSGDPAKGSRDEEVEWSAWTLDANTPNIMIFDTDSDGTTRMIADQESGDRIRDDLFADTRLPSLEYKCRLHVSTRYWDPAHEPTAGGRCSSDAASALAAE
ncbi:MAG: carboxylesterase family protein, partial [Pseudomonadota bacterium]